MLSILKDVGVTSIEMTHSFEFTFIECEKEDNVSWTLEMCRNLSRDLQNMS